MSKTGNIAPSESWGGRVLLPLVILVNGAHHSERLAFKRLCATLPFSYLSLFYFLFCACLEVRAP